MHWGYLREVLVQRGFFATWVSWMMALLGKQLIPIRDEDEREGWECQGRLMKTTTKVSSVSSPVPSKSIQKDEGFWSFGSELISLTDRSFIKGFQVE